MIKNLVTLGDSWVYGDELGDDDYRQQHIWPTLVARHFGLNLVNLGFNGESQQSSIWSMLWWLENHYVPDSMVLLAITQSWRVSWFRASHAHDPFPWSAHANIVAPFDEPAYHELKKIHIGVSACDTLDRFNRQQTLLFFDGVCQMYRLPVRYFDLYPDQGDFFGSNHLFPGENATAWVGKNKKALGHPDEKGHSIIAEKLIDSIKSVKILE